MIGLLFMTDRVYLEQAESSELLYNYNDQNKRNGPVIARQWLERRISYLSGMYGSGFSERVRGYMRKLSEMNKTLC
jgi:hypothetical protein